MGKSAATIKLYIGNLPYGCNEDKLERFIRGLGVHPSTVEIPSVEGGRDSFGYGVITVPTADHEIIIERLHDQHYHNRKIVCAKHV